LFRMRNWCKDEKKRGMKAREKRNAKRKGGNWSGTRNRGQEKHKKCSGTPTLCIG